MTAVRSTADPPDRALLLAFVRHGCQSAFAELVRRHASLVYGVCRRAVGNAADADDAFQATFLVLARRAASLRSDDHLPGWLHTVAGRTARELRHMRDRRRTRELASGLRERAGGAATDPDLAAVLDDELAKLPEHYRLPILLCELQGQSRKAAAAALAIPEGTLSSRLAKAKATLAERLTRRGVAPAVAAIAVPPGLVANTIRAAAGGGSAVAARLADTVVKVMVATKLKTIAVAVCVLAVGVGTAVRMNGGPADDPAALVTQLGAPAFADRQAAEAKLKALGAGAKPALLAGAKSPDAEVAARAAALLAGVRKQELWERFAAVAGDDDASRALFADVRGVPGVVEQLQDVIDHPGRAGETYQKWFAALNAKAKEAGWPARNPIYRGSSHAPPAETAAWMFLGTFAGTETDGTGERADFIAYTHDVHRNPPYEPWHGALAFGPHRLPLKKLVAAWLDRRTDHHSLSLGLPLIHELDDRDRLDAVRRAVRRMPDEWVDLRALAVVILGRLGTPADVPLVLRANDPRPVASVYRGPSPKDEIAMKFFKPEMQEGRDLFVQLRDVAVPAALHLAGRKPEAFGFGPWPTFRHPGGSLKDGTSVATEFGFTRPADRDAAFVKVKAWLDGQKPAAPDHPAWDVFKKAAGDTLATRELFDAMIADADVSKRVADAADPKKAATAYALAGRRMVRNAEAYRGQPPGPIRVSPPSLPELAEFLTMGATATNAYGDAGAEWACQRTAYYLNPTYAGAHGPAMRDLFAGWLANQPPEPHAIGTDRATRARVKQALPDARAKADDPKLAAGYRYAVLRLLGRLGDETDRVRLARFLNDPLVCKPNAQVMDVAAAMLVHRFGHNQEWFWGDIQGDAPPAYVRWLDGEPKGFMTPMARAAAHKRTRAWLAAQGLKLPASADANELVRTLASAAFADRDAAQRELRAMGVDAKAALKDGAASADPEVAERCRTLLAEVNRMIVAERFAKVIGDDAASRKLFALIAGDAKSLAALVAVHDNPADAAAVYAKRAGELTEQGRIPSGVGSFSAFERVSAAESAGFLYLGTFPGTEGKPRMGQKPGWLPHDHGSMWDRTVSPFAQAIQAGELAAPLRVLAARWAANRRDSGGVELGLFLAARYQLRDVLPHAKRVATRPDEEALYNHKQAALLAVGRCGTAADIPFLEPFLRNDGHCGGCIVMDKDEPLFTGLMQSRPGIDPECQYRDVAMAMVLHLRGQDPDAFGFYWASSHGDKPEKPRHPFDPNTVGFKTAAARDAAHAKAAAWLAANPAK